MKKHLLGTSAIVAASLGMATAAYAQNPPVTSNVRNGINLTVTGFVGSIVGFIYIAFFVAMFAVGGPG